MKILANDGLHSAGQEALRHDGFEVITDKVPQENLAAFINENNIEVLLVRSATKVRKELIDQCPNLKIVGRGGVGLDNIDVDYARSKGVQVINTPAASSASVAELVFAHLSCGARFMEMSNRAMPATGNIDFAKLKKSYAKGIELRGKTIGIIGMGRIGREVAKIAIGRGMRVIGTDAHIRKMEVRIDFYNGAYTDFEVVSEPMENLLRESDFITLHVPAQDHYLIDTAEIEQMKEGVALINCARGGVVNEKALLSGLESGKISFAGIDVYENEPTPSQEILHHPKISLTPHIGAATVEAQERIGLSLAKQIAQILEVHKA